MKFKIVVSPPNPFGYDAKPRLISSHEKVAWHIILTPILWRSLSIPPLRFVDFRPFSTNA